MTLADALKMYKYQLFACLLLLVATYYSIVPPMVMQWYQDDNYSHGFIVPLIAGFFLYERREELKRTLIAPWWPGIVVVAAGVIQLLAGWLGTELFTMRSSLIVILAGMTLFFFGREVLRKSLLPILYLFLMVPIPYIIYDAVAFPLKLFVTRASVAVLKMIGIVVMREFFLHWVI